MVTLITIALKKMVPEYTFIIISCVTNLDLIKSTMCPTSKA